jgi:hypothetical protein
MSSWSKGQIGAVTVVLLTGITVGVASVVYVWGEPILDKRESGNELDNVESLVLDVRDEIQRIDQAGEGATGEIPLQVDTEDYSVNLVRLNATNDYIDIVVEGGEFPYPEGSWTLLDGENMRNLSISGGDYVLKGEDKGGVVLVQTSSQVATYRVEFRNLYAENEEVPLEKIDLVERGSTVTGSGSIYLSNQGSTVNSGIDGLTVSSGQTLDRELTQIQVEMR